MDLSKIRDLKDLQSLLDLMGRYDVEEIELEGEGLKIRVRKAGRERELIGYPMVGSPLLAPPASGGGPGAPGGGAGTPAGAAPPPPVNPRLREVTSPMVGTFYRASSPEAEPFAKEGDSVLAESIIGIIEAMKVMNEIPAGIAGIVREILVKNGESVEFGQPLFRIETE